MESRYVLGIDGGGTATTALLSTSAGRVLARGTGGPANMLIVGEDTASVSLRDAIEAALSTAPNSPLMRSDIAAVTAGLAGIHVSGDGERLINVVRELLPNAQVHIYNDGEIALTAATGGAAGIVVVAGTGSIAYGSDEAGHHLRCGGWGYIMGDEGSAYAIAQAALRAAARAVDGRAPGSALVSALTEALNVPTFDDILLRVYGPPAISRRELAALAPLVSRCAIEGDEVAQAILATSGEDLATLAIALARRLGLIDAPLSISYSGSVWRAGNWILEPFRRHIHTTCSHAIVDPPLLAPEAGAALLAIRLLDEGKQPRAEIVAALRETGGAGEESLGIRHV